MILRFRCSSLPILAHSADVSLLLGMIIRTCGPPPSTPRLRLCWLSRRGRFCGWLNECSICPGRVCFWILGSILSTKYRRIRSESRNSAVWSLFHRWRCYRLRLAAARSTLITRLTHRITRLHVVGNGRIGNESILRYLCCLSIWSYLSVRFLCGIDAHGTYLRIIWRLLIFLPFSIWRKKQKSKISVTLVWVESTPAPFWCIFWAVSTLFLGLGSFAGSLLVCCKLDHWPQLSTSPSRTYRTLWVLWIAIWEISPLLQTERDTYRVRLWAHHKSIQ